jgi:hypothetical protein
MKIFETLDRDPRTSALANSGQARIEARADERTIQELRAELETFVCDGQYARAIETILRSYLTHLDRPRQDSAWVSGFFGSGKSHLLKMLGHLWVNTEFEDGSTARSLVRGLPEDVVALLRELDTQVKRSGLPPVAAAASLQEGSREVVRLTVLAVVLRACGLPEQYPQAQFCFWLREQGYLDQVRTKVEGEGKDWLRELNNLYVSGLIARAVLECDSNFASDEKEARQVLRSRFPLPTGDISTADFIQAAREALSADDVVPLTILILDEVQQYIGDSKDRAGTITELAEAVQTQLDSRVMLVMSGQSALSGTPLLQWLQDRFRIRVQLSDADVEAVIRKVLLHKKPKAVEPIRKVLEQNAGEISKHLQGTKLAERPEDRGVLVEDYPLLPTRRRFWEESFRAVDAAGTHSQLRSQLRILHDALQTVATSELGALIPADALFEAIAPDMVNTGVLLSEIATRIEALDDGSEKGRLRKRIAGLVFLINKLPRESGVDAGIRATPRMIADLLVGNLSDDSGPLRKEVSTQLEALAEDGIFMKVGEEFRLQTTEGAEWDRAFRERVGTLGQKEMEIAAKRDQLLGTAIQNTVGEVRLQHGQSKLRRTLVLHAQPDDPPDEKDQVVVWLRDGWNVEQKRVEDEARRRGLEDPVVHLFLPKKAADDLRKGIVEAEAARSVLDMKGIPAGDEGKEARRSMESRLSAAEGFRDDLVREIVAAARVYQGGGNEVFGDSLRERLNTAANAALSRLFPRFQEGDHGAWEAAMRRAKDGSDQPFKVVGWDRATEEHPVVRQVLVEIGNGAKGTEIRKTLKGSPFGWPQDAVDAALISLHFGGAIRVTLNGQAVAPKALDQNRIAAAYFYPERIRLGTTEKLALRGLYQKAGVSVRSGEEEVKAPLFLDAVRVLAQGSGGDPPLPQAPSCQQLDDLKKLAGNEQLAKILEVKDDLNQCIEDWQVLKERAEERGPSWRKLQKLAEHAQGLPVLGEVQPEIDAILADRSLLAETDYVTPLRKALENALREVVTNAHKTCQEIFDRESAALEASEDWKKLPREKRLEISRSNRIELIGPLDVGDEDCLLEALTRRSLAGWEELAAALPTRFANARADAAKALEPKTQTVSLRSDTLRNEDEVRAWIADTESGLLRRLKDGPIVIG